MSNNRRKKERNSFNIEFDERNPIKKFLKQTEKDIFGMK
jgi:hypothetical protein